MVGVVAKGEGRLALKTVGAASCVAWHPEVSDLELSTSGSGQGQLERCIEIVDERRRISGKLMIAPRSLLVIWFLPNYTVTFSLFVHIKIVALKDVPCSVR